MDNAIFEPSPRGQSRSMCYCGAIHSSPRQVARVLRECAPHARPCIAIVVSRTTCPQVFLRNDALVFDVFLHRL